MTELLTSCEQFRDPRGRLQQANARRLRAFVLLLRYSGLRISDAASCAVDRLHAGRLFLYTQKTNVPVYIPLPEFVVGALDACRHISERYGFWTGVGSKTTLAGNWRHNVSALVPDRRRQGWSPASLSGHAGESNYFLSGMPIERVSILAWADSSVKITERHYSPWVEARQAQLESDLRRAWSNDPIAQREMLLSAPATGDSSVRMAATYSRHENGEAAN